MHTPANWGLEPGSNARLAAVETMKAAKPKSKPFYTAPASFEEVQRISQLLRANYHWTAADVSNTRTTRAAR